MNRCVVLVSHDAGGTVPPMLALAEAFVARRVNVTWIGQPSIERRAVAGGCRFVPLPGLPNYQARIAIEEQPTIAFPMITGTAVGDALTSVVTAEGADTVIVDANLTGALAAAEVLPCRSAVLLHSMYATFTDTWFADLWPLLADAINATRRQFGLGPADGWAAVFGAHDRIISVVPERFDAPVAERPPTMRHHGFLVPATGPTGPSEFPAGDGDRVVVGLSTTFQQQEGLLQTILEALGSLPVQAIASTGGQVERDRLRCPPNAVVHEYVDFGTALESADVMVTHAGLGTIAAALSAAVPLVCTPIARDQHLNSAQVEAVGAGLTVPADAGATIIADAIQKVLADAAYSDAAATIATESDQAGGPNAIAADLEQL